MQLRLWQLGVPALAAMIGVLAGLSPQFGLAAALAVVFVALVLNDLALGLGLFMVVAFLEGIGDLGSLSLAKATGGLLLVSWLASRLNEQEDRRELMRDHPVLVATAVALSAWVLVSAVWAELPDLALGSAMRWIPNLGLFAIAYAGIRKPQHVRWIFALFVIGAFLSALIGFATGAGNGGDRLAGDGINANELGGMLAVGVILCTALGSCRDISPGARVLAFVGAGAAMIVLLMTGSRGALIALIAALVVAPVLVGKGRRLAVLTLAVVGAGLGFVYLNTVAPAGVAERLTESERTGSGRTDIWKVGWRIVEDRPVLGVGADNFANSTIHYLLEPGAVADSEFIVDQPKVAHNIFLQVLAELGVIGLAMFLTILAIALWSASRAAVAFARAGDRSMEILTRGLLIGMWAMLAGQFFGTGLYSKQMWLLLGMCVAMGALARRSAPSPQAR